MGRIMALAYRGSHFDRPLLGFLYWPASALDSRVSWRSISAVDERIYRLAVSRAVPGTGAGRHGLYLLTRASRDAKELARPVVRRPGCNTRTAECPAIEEAPMNGLIYLVGLIVIIMFILSFLGLR
jgi:hypothetical protein